MDDLRQALRLVHTLWGGRFNPIIPIGATEEDDAEAKALVDAFKIDVLYPVTSVRLVEDFINGFTYLPWPLFHKSLFVGSARGKVASFMDIYHPVRRLFEEYIKDKPEPKIKGTFYEWMDSDPLKDVFAASFGLYPTQAEVDKDYTEFFVKYLHGERVTLNSAEPVPTEAYKELTPSVVSSWGLEIERSFRQHDNPGFYVGDCDDFNDITWFWNLRAADIDLVFYDPRHQTRLDGLKRAWIDVLGKRATDPIGLRNAVAVWARRLERFEGQDFGPQMLRCLVGLNVEPPTVHINEQSVLGSVADSGGRQSISFQLPPKQFSEDVGLYSQNLIVGVDPIVELSEDTTVKPPYIPELNEYYGREFYFRWNQARSQKAGIGIILGVTHDDLTLRALPNRELISKIFRAFGMEAQPSKPGLIASRLIRQMDGLQGCRVFKIEGVRKLIEKYGPLGSFTRSGAIQIIGQNDPVTGKPRFSDFEGLFIEQRDYLRLKPEDALRYLTQQNVFRVGLNLHCQHCELDFWLSLDDLATDVRCELCGHLFNITSQLRDRDWTYRRSGLFGREDHQEGAIPVAITLQQLATTIHGLIYTTAMSITSLGAKIAACETDFVAISQGGYENRVALAVGECKSKQEITEEDVAHLKAVADAFPRNRIDAYIVFAKTTPFTATEITRCRAAQAPHRFRVILLAQRELEPYFVYERTEKEFVLDSTAISFEDLARGTHQAYFDPKPKAGPVVPPEAQDAVAGEN
ncbi:MAG TPA: hypothetical protein VG759_21910 [Candidatus Angelobacter sp.]|jgi:hypothetical protein|nr:hypothetical protein [Candidatus Angelobacter sp.]